MKTRTAIIISVVVALLLLIFALVGVLVGVLVTRHSHDKKKKDLTDEDLTKADNTGDTYGVYDETTGEYVYKDMEPGGDLPLGADMGPTMKELEEQGRNRNSVTMRQMAMLRAKRYY